MNRKNNPNNNDIPLPKIIQESHPFMEKIRASWIANTSHGKKDSPCARDNLTRYDAGMCEEWSGEMGFLRYYIWHIDNGYIPGKTKLERKDITQGFRPENCVVVDNTKVIKQKPLKKPVKSKNKSQTNNMLLNPIMIDNIETFFGSLGIQTFDLCQDINIIMFYKNEGRSK